MNIHREQVLNHARPIVWEALTTSELMSEWLMDNDFMPVEGHEFIFRTDPAPGFDGIVHSKVLKIIDQERLSLSWRSGSLDTLLIIDLRDEGEGKTRIILNHSGFGMSEIIAKFILGAGWKRILRKRLPSAISGSKSQYGEVIPA